MKLTDLAIYTGKKPYWDPPLCVGKPDTRYKDEFLKRANAVFDRGVLANNGPEVYELENRVAELTGCKYAVAVCNATIGLELCIRELAQGGLVAVPTWTFPAAPHAVLNSGKKPLFVDAIHHRDWGAHQPAAGNVEYAIRYGLQVGLLIGFFAWGCTEGAAAWRTLADQHSIPLIFDAAHALGCKETHMIKGDAHVYSLHATKLVGGFEGGVVCTADNGLATALRMARNFGFGTYAARQIADHGYAEILHQGTNAKMHELSAAMANISLTHLDETIELYRLRYERYCENLRGQEGLSIYSYPSGHNYQYIVIDWRGVWNTGHVVNILYHEGVHARRYFAPGCHKLEPFRAYAQPFYSMADALAEHTIVLPTGPQMSLEDADRICEILLLLSTQEAICQSA